MRHVALVLVGLLVVGGGYAVQHMRLERAEARAALLQTDLTAAHKDAAAWKLAADQARAGQSALAGQAQSCLDREAAAQADAEAIAAILDAARVTEISPDTARQGVDDVTRRAAADYLNRPL